MFANKIHHGAVSEGVVSFFSSLLRSSLELIDTKVYAPEIRALQCPRGVNSPWGSVRGQAAGRTPRQSRSCWEGAQIKLLNKLIKFIRYAPHWIHSDEGLRKHTAVHRAFKYIEGELRLSEAQLDVSKARPRGNLGTPSLQKCAVVPKRARF